MKRLPPLSLTTIWLLLPITLVVWSTLLDPLRRLDVWWHLKVGELILTSGHIPATDIFSFTEYGKAFAHPNWLAEVLFYGLWRIGELELLVLFNAVVISTAFLIVYRTAYLPTIPPRAVAAIMLVVAFSFALYSNLRTQIFSFGLLALFLFILWNYRAQRHTALIWLLPVLMAVWVNVHGAFIIGLITLVIVLVSESVRYRLDRSRASTSALLPLSALYRLAMVVGLTLVATLINPYGVDIYRYVQQVGADPSSQIFVIEWQTPRITNIEHVLSFFLPFFSAILIFIYSQRRLDLAELGIFLFFSAFGLTSARNGIWFVIAVMPIAAWHLPNIPALATLLQARQPEAGATRPSWLANAINWLLLIALGATTVLFSPWVRPHVGITALRPSLIDPAIPVAAFEYIEQAGITGRMFHHQDFGDYLIWRLWPQQYTFIDGRVHLFSYQIVNDYLQTLNGTNWEAIMDKYGIAYIFLPKPVQTDEADLPILHELRHSSQWTLMYEDDKSVIYKKVANN
ncbi:hypothetical protein [Chloroflexus sp.]|uniref:hypothetical protein n=1 Tax=Chloroflexus sp. TaxID=1904827 RepID=UPI002ACE80C7|nr:hypothetical protein [Chloroflexus sp.]